MKKNSRTILTKETAIALKAEISKYSDTYNIKKNKKLVEDVVKTVTEKLLKEWLNNNIDKVVKNSIKEELANIAKKNITKKK